MSKENRRNILKGLAIGGPVAWAKPVVDSVVIPAHGATTCGEQRCPSDEDCEMIRNVCGDGAVGSPQEFDDCLTSLCLNPDADCLFNPVACLAPSDIRLKTNIKPLLAKVNGHQLYQFQYESDHTQQKYVGVMAQDLVIDHPEVLHMGQDGYYRVNYSALNLKMTTLEEWEERGFDSVIVH